MFVIVGEHSVIGLASYAQSSALTASCANWSVFSLACIPSSSSSKATPRMLAMSTGTKIYSFITVK